MATVTNEIRVTNAAELDTALANATGGEKIILASGNYGDLSLRGGNYDETVTIVSEDPEDVAVFDSAYILQSGNLTFDNVFFNFVPNEESSKHDTAIRLIQTNDISIVNSKIEGGPSVNGVPIETEVGGLDATGNVIGLPVGNAVVATESSNFSMVGNEISAFSKGINLFKVDGVTFTDNDAFGMRSTFLRGAVIDNAVVDNNTFHDSNPWNSGGQGDHADFVHFWTDERYQDDADTNITISNNYFYQGDGQLIFGINLEDNANGLGFENVRIENNVIHNGHSNGMRLESVRDGVIKGNTLLSTTDDNKVQIVIKANSGNLTIEDNIAGGVIIDTDEGSDFALPEGAAETIIQTNNLFVQSTDYGAENYYGDIFINPLTPGAQLADLMAKPGGIVEEMGVGADATRFVATPDELTAVIHPSQDEHEIFDFVFDAQYTANPNGLTGENATYEWDFGDGNTGTGMRVEYTYPEPGSYDVTLTVTDSSGAVDTTKAFAYIYDPQLLDLSIGENGMADLSSHGVEIINKVDNPQDFIVGDAYHLSDTNDFTVEKADDLIHRANEFSVSFAIKRDGNDSDHGVIMSLHGEWGISTTANGAINVFLMNQDDDRLNLSTAPVVTDTEWHVISFAYDSVAGEAALFVDGVNVAADSFTGQTGVPSFARLMVGNSFGSNFNGLIKGIEVRRDAPDDMSQPPARHNDLRSEIDGTLDNDFVDSGAGDNNIDTGVGDDVIEAGDGDDVIASGYGNDIVRAGAGDDHVLVVENAEARGESKSFDGGDGVDALDFANFHSAIKVDLSGDGFAWTSDGVNTDGVLRSFADHAGFENLYGSAYSDEFSGDDNANVLRGNGGHDIMDGGRGDDLLEGGMGDDELLGGRGNDIIEGGDGDDILNGRQGRDALYGGDGDDILFVDGLDDPVRGGAGFDQIVVMASLGVNIDMETAEAELGYGNRGDDWFVGGAERVILHGNGGDDVLIGGDGDDVLIGRQNADTLIGGAGDDYIYMDALDLAYEGGEGIDTLFVQAGKAVNIDMEATGFEIAHGNRGDDTFRGSNQDDIIHGGDGDDRLIGNGGDDKLFGGAGDDILTGRQNSDMLDGGAGDDVLYVDGLDVSVNGGSGDDILVVQASLPVDIDLAAASIETAYGNNGDDVFDASGMTQPGAGVVVNGGGGDDVLTSGRGDDVLIGGAGDDIFVFRQNWGQDTVSGQFNNGIEQIRFGSDVLDGAGGSLEFSDLLIAENTDGNAVVSIQGGGGDSITIVGTNIAALDQSDFFFA